MVYMIETRITGGPLIRHESGQTRTLSSLSSVREFNIYLFDPQSTHKVNEDRSPFSTLDLKWRVNEIQSLSQTLFTEVRLSLTSELSNETRNSGGSRIIYDRGLTKIISVRPIDILFQIETTFGLPSHYPLCVFGQVVGTVDG